MMRERRFNNEYIYLSFHSVLGCSISVLCDFQNEEKHSSRHQRVPDEPERETVASMALGYSGKGTTSTNTLNASMMRDETTVNHIQNNVHKAALWLSFAEESRSHRLTTMETRLRQAKKRQRELFMTNMKRNIFYLNRWEIIRQKRDEQAKVQHEI